MWALLLYTDMGSCFSFKWSEFCIIGALGHYYICSQTQMAMVNGSECRNRGGPQEGRGVQVAGWALAEVAWDITLCFLFRCSNLCPYLPHSLLFLIFAHTSFYLVLYPDPNKPWLIRTANHLASLRAVPALYAESGEGSKKKDTPMSSCCVEFPFMTRQMGWGMEPG